MSEETKPQLSYMSDETLEAYKKLPLEVKLTRIGDVSAAGQLLLTTLMLRHQNKLTEEQFQQVSNSCVQLVEAIHLPDDKYDVIFKETGALVDQILGVKKISAEDRQKMN